MMVREHVAFGCGRLPVANVLDDLIDSVVIDAAKIVGCYHGIEESMLFEIEQPALPIA